MHAAAPAPTDLDRFIQQGWQRHAQQPEALARELLVWPLATVDTEARLLKLAALGHHVLGEHLGRWQEGLAWLQPLAALPVCGEEGRAALRRLVASLHLAAGPGAPDPCSGLTASDTVRAQALAAASLVPHDQARASAWLQQALAGFDAAALPGTDAAARALAVTGNNLACELEEKPARQPGETALMLQAARIARRFWALAGGALETERAEYRLAMTCLQAGDPAQALQHAQACLALVEAQPPGPEWALERFFGQEARARAASGLGSAEALAQAQTAALAAWAELSADDQAACQPTLQQVQALPG